MSIRLGFIGDGGVSRTVRESLRSDQRFDVVAILPRTSTGVQGAAFDAFMKTLPDVVVECAAGEAISTFGEAILRGGTSMIVISTGALADAALAERLSAAAHAGQSRLICASGAIGGIEALGAARYGGLRRVCYRGRKPPRAWTGTAAESLVDLRSLTQPATFFNGCARRAALDYPKNANVAATVALAGIGFDDTEVELVADPGIEQNVHELTFEGADGNVEIVISGQPSQSNPKTSVLTAHSILRLLVNMTSPFVI